MRKKLFKVAAIAASCLLLAGTMFGQRQIENLGRGVVALNKGSNQVYISWRLLALDPSGIAFNLYRSTNGGTAAKLNSSPITVTTDFVDNNADITKSNAYFVKPIINGTEQAASASFTMAANTPVQNFLSINLQPMSDGQYQTQYVYVGDVDGDGEFEFIAYRNGTQQLVECYKLDGRFLWRIQLGKVLQDNDGGGYLVVGDFDGDGKAEIALKTGEGTTFANGAKVTGTGGEDMLSIVQGNTGNELARALFEPSLSADPVGKWGKGMRPYYVYMGLASVDGVHPGFICARGIGGPTQLQVCAYNYLNGKLTKVWSYDCNTNKDNIVNSHSMLICDVDGDGKDEACFLGGVVDHDGTVLSTNADYTLYHGDHYRYGVFDPSRGDIIEYAIQQNNPNKLGQLMLDPRTGKWLVTKYMSAVGDASRGDCAPFDPRLKGAQFYAAYDGNFYDYKGNATGVHASQMVDLAIWWDSDLAREIWTGAGSGEMAPVIDKVDANGGFGRLVSLYQDGTTQGYGGFPCLIADILGDWREEAIVTTSDYSKLYIYSTTDPATNRIYTLMQNPCYRTQMTCRGRTGSYNTDYYLGPQMGTPPTPNVVYVGGTCSSTPINPYIQVNGGTWQNVSSVTVNAGDAIIIGPQPITGGSWSWTGCGTSGTARQQTIAASGTCTSTSTYTNTCGAKSTQNFTITVNGSPIGGIVSGGTYTITAKNSGKVLDVTGNSTADGAVVQQYTGSGATNQQWVVTNNGSNYTIASVKSGKVVDVTGNSLVNGAIIEQWTANGGTNQQWVLTSDGNGYYQVQSVRSGLCLDVPGSTALDTALQQYTCNGHDNQKFSFTQLKSAPVIAAATIPQSNTMSVSPNPVNGSSAQLTIGLDAKSEVSIMVLDYLGKIVYQKNLGVREAGAVSETLDLSSVAKGTYIVKVQTKNGTKTTKLVRL